VSGRHSNRRLLQAAQFTTDRTGGGLGVAQSSAASSVPAAQQQLGGFGTGQHSALLSVPTSRSDDLATALQASGALHATDVGLVAPVAISAAAAAANRADESARFLLPGYVCLSVYYLGEYYFKDNTTHGRWGGC